MKKNNFNVEKAETRFSYNNKKIIETIFTSDVERSKATVIKAIKDAQKMSLADDKLKNYDFIVSLKFNGGWRSEKLFSLTEEPVLFDPDDHLEESGTNIIIEKNGKIEKKRHTVNNQDTFKMFSIFYIPKAEKKGGCRENSKTNDCLYETISKIVNGKDNLLKCAGTPMKFKKALSIDRNDKVDISKMPEVEKLIKCNVNVSGDHEYTSQNKYIRTVNITLKNEHYSVDTTLKVKKFDIVPNKKMVAFFELVDGTYNIITCTNEWSVKKSETKYLNELYPNYMFVQKNGGKKTLKEKFTEFTKARQDLLADTKGFINLNMFPIESMMARYIYHCKSSSVPEPEDISTLEGSWIYSSYQGALMYSKDGEYENAFCIDQNSMYSHFLIHPNFYIPWCEGSFQVMKDSDLKEFVPFGIYRCKITSTDTKYNKFFRFNRKNFYTHHDINLARLLKFTVELIHDSEANCLIYDTTKRIQGRIVYGSTIEYLYRLKRTIPYVKKIMSAFWGSQCEKNIKKIKSSSLPEEIVTLDSDFKLETIEKYDDCYKASMVSKGKIFKSNYARLGTFLTSYCRYNMAKFIIEHVKNVDNVLRIHTDSYIAINEEIPKDALGSDIGQFKIEKHSDCKILNVNNVEWYENSLKI